MFTSEISQTIKPEITHECPVGMNESVGFRKLHYRGLTNVTNVTNCNRRNADCTINERVGSFFVDFVLTRCGIELNFVLNRAVNLVETGAKPL